MEIVFAGAPRGADAAGTRLPPEEGTTVPIRQGDYLGLVLINDEVAAGPALVPFTRDDWTRLSWPDGTPRLAGGVVAYRTRLDPADTPDSVLEPGAPAHRTYPQEFRSPL